MKIVCESCGAKYSIADEKVAGKVFKIRCKKCSAVIVVKGDNNQEEGDEATRVFDYGADAIWHVVVGGDQQGPFAPRQIADMLAETKIDWEAYVWREGMDGWQPAKDVEALVSAVMAEAEGGAPEPSATAGGYGSGRVFGGSSDMGADPFAGDDGGLSGVIGQAAKGSSSSGGGTADLFAQAGRSPFSGAVETEAKAGMSNGQSPHVGEEALTGQRNENSVLFSLSNLQALATGSGGAPQSSRPKPGMAQGEGSGLIDIRALASASQTVQENKTNGVAVKESVQDLLAVGGSTTAFSTASLAAPIAAESSANNNRLLIGGLIAALVAVVGMAAVLVLRTPPAAAPIAAAPPAAAAPAATAAQAAAAPTPPATAPSAAEPAKESDDDSADPSDDSAAARADREKPDTSSQRRAGAARDRKKSSGDGEVAAKAAPAEEPEPVAAAPAKPAKPSGDQSIDDLLDSALGGKPAKKAATAAVAAEPSANLPNTPGRDDVLGAMKSVTSRVQSCGNGQSGVAMAKISVAGPTGRVTNVDVSGSFSGTPVASCVVKEVSKARFPKFQQNTFSVTYPFKI
jgi:predicted Zn finger-like uncharacterized protein